jgi:hypothetical protein
MRNAMKQLGMGLGFLFTLGTSSAALAYPPQCYDICSCSSSCITTCYQGTARSTCADEICVDYCGASAPRASVSQSSSTQDEQEQQDASQDVCTDKTEQAQSSKS